MASARRNVVRQALMMFLASACASAKIGENGVNHGMLVAREAWLGRILKAASNGGECRAAIRSGARNEAVFALWRTWQWQRRNGGVEA